MVSQWISKEMSQAQAAPGLGFGERLAFILKEMGEEMRPNKRHIHTHTHTHCPPPHLIPCMLQFFNLGVIKF